MIQPAQKASPSLSAIALCMMATTAGGALTLAATPVQANTIVIVRDDDDDDRRGHWQARGGHRGGWDRDDRRRSDDRWRGHPRQGYWQGRDSRGYWGPAGQQWSRWDNSWGNPVGYARQWGFDEYCPQRGWRRGTSWYSSPSQWSGWGGWNWSVSVSGSQPGNGWNGNGWNGNGWNSGHSGWNQPQTASCQRVLGEDWVQGRRAQVSYVACVDRFGRWIEQPNTRRVDHWIW